MLRAVSCFLFVLGMPVSMVGGMGMPVSGIMPQASLGTATMTTGSLSMGPRMANGAAGTMLPSGNLGHVPLAGPGQMTGTSLLLK